MCKDKSLSQLEKMGYNVINLPREDIHPLQVFTRPKGNFERYGEITEFVIEDQPETPRISKNEDAANIKGLRTDKFEFGAGFKILEKYLSSIGGGEIGLETIFKNTDSIQFIYQNVKIDSVLPAKIRTYLSSVNPKDSMMDIIDEKGEAYIITEILKSNAFGVDAYDSKGAKINLSLPEIKEIFKANFNIEVSKDYENVVSFEGKNFLCFAIKPAVVWVEKVDGKALFKLGMPGYIRRRGLSYAREGMPEASEESTELGMPTSMERGITISIGEDKTTYKETKELTYVTFGNDKLINLR